MAPAMGVNPYGTDSEDEDYEDDAPIPPRRNGSKSKSTSRNKNYYAKKSRRITDEDEITDDDVISSLDDEPEEPVHPDQLNARGSQRRRTVPTNGYKEKDASDEEAYDEASSGEDEVNQNDEVVATIEEASVIDDSVPTDDSPLEQFEPAQPSKVVKLPFNSRRVTRNTCAVDDGLFALSESGRHANVVDKGSKRPASRQPAGKKPPGKKLKGDDSDDFKPDEEDEESSNDDASSSPPSRSRKGTQTQDDSPSARPRTRAFSEQEEMAEELHELGVRSKKRVRSPQPAHNRVKRNKPIHNYAIPHPDEAEQQESEKESPFRRGPTGPWKRTLFPTAGPFGGARPSILGPVEGNNALVDFDADSSDEESSQPDITPSGQAVPTSTDKVSGKVVNLGKLKDKKILSDADPLGVDLNVDFDSVGGLQGHILQLKEMLALPLLYPEIFAKFGIVPPRGALFHGPPGTGKTLVARALSNSLSSEGHKVTFYMRKGADLLSKWVGEGERQLVLLFEEAKKTAPSIIFFDEIDGLAPPRSGKSEQSHTTSLVSTLLSLMDGLDGRGQVIVLGATNRPDAVDPALRRPGRFDREFYFPLPDTEGRRAILDIHTKGWNPALSEVVKDEIAQLTKGYGGADLRALCMEAALIAVQRRYPQIYKSAQKLLIDPTTITVLPTDFMAAAKKILPSSERSTSSGASRLPESIEPLLRCSLKRIEIILKDVLPQYKPLTTLEAAEYEEDSRREKNLEEFDRSRVYRPRLLIRGNKGMGQQYLAAALLNGFDGLHVQSFDLPTLISDSTRSLEMAVLNSFTEVRKHKQGVIFIPDLQAWCDTVGPTIIKTFMAMMRSIPPTDPILLLGVLESTGDGLDHETISDLFGSSKNNVFDLDSPDDAERHAFFSKIIAYIMTPPSEFPESTRKKRQLEKLPLAPPPPPKAEVPLTKQQLKAQKKQDRTVLHLLKLRIQPTMTQAKKARKFRTGIIDETKIRYLYDEADPDIVTGDVHNAEDRPYEKALDKNGVIGLREVSTDKFYYNMDLSLIEKRLSNGFYTRFGDFLADFKKIAKDARVLGDEERIIRANELLANVEMDITAIEQSDPLLIFQTDQLHSRMLARNAVVAVATEEVEENSSRLVRNPISNGSGNTGPDLTVGQLHSQMLAQNAVVTAATEEEVEGTPSRPAENSVSNGSGNTGPDLTVGQLNSQMLAQNAVVTAATEEEVEGTPSRPSGNSVSNGSGNTGPDLTVYPDRGDQEDHLPDTQQGTQQGSVVVDSEVVEELHQALTDKSRGLSVEQLQHISSTITVYLWEKRGEWDRTQVCRGAIILLDQVLGETLL
ncbi:hypothetical protein N7495_002926, partial [Penicillium taxi]|uniref:uncharacterized protein n=1 Tax=Penicillium taxi TaxID=168475 RepID=UPI002545153D